MRAAATIIGLMFMTLTASAAETKPILLQVPDAAIDGTILTIKQTESFVSREHWQKRGWKEGFSPLYINESAGFRLSKRDRRAGRLLVEFFRIPGEPSAQFNRRIANVERVIRRTVQKLGHDFAYFHGFSSYENSNLKGVEVVPRAFLLPGPKEKRILVERYETMPGKTNVEIVRAIIAQLNIAYPPSKNKIIETQGRAAQLPGNLRCVDIFG